MRLLFVSDIHYSLKQFDWLVGQAGSYDAVAIGGDLLDLASGLDPDVQITVVERYLELLRAKTVLAVSSGNHDGDGRNAADEAVAEWVRGARGNRLFADGDSFDLGETRVTVCPWWDGDVTRGEIEAQLAGEAERRAGRRWIWIHHAPPEGSRTSWTGKKFIGDAALRGWIDRFSPEIVLSGHIHNSPFYADGAWADRVGRTWTFNPGRQIGGEPATITLDLGAMTAEWRSLEGVSTCSLGIEEG